MIQSLDNMFGFALRQPIYKTLTQMRILQVSGFATAMWLTVDAWVYMKDYALKHPEATWLIAAMPAFIAASVSGLLAMVTQIRKPHEGDK